MRRRATNAWAVLFVQALAARLACAQSQKEIDHNVAQYVVTAGRVTVLHRVRNEQRWRQQVVDDVLTGESTFSDRVLSGGVKVALSRNWSFDLGYMQVFQQQASGYQYDLNHTLRWFFYWTPDLRAHGTGGFHPVGGEE